MAITNLSILIPTYNDLCVNLVERLRLQAEEAGIAYEILVADDGSTDKDVVRQNSAISQWSHCRYLRHTDNIGRAAIRNLLVRTAQYEWLLFIDSDMTLVRPDFLARYLLADDADVIDGGVAIGGEAETLKGNLRYRYEKSAEHEHTVEIRRSRPYRDFHTANFLIRRDLMLGHPFDERFRCYGYEDVIFGKTLQRHQISIQHIDNPVVLQNYESNDRFISKTEESLRTLYQFRDELQGYSGLLDLANRLPQSLVRYWHRHFRLWERRLLTGNHPSLLLFNIYRLGYFLSIRS